MFKKLVLLAALVAGAFVATSATDAEAGHYRYNGHHHHYYNSYRYIYPSYGCHNYYYAPTYCAPAYYVPSYSYGCYGW